MKDSPEFYENLINHNISRDIIDNGFAYVQNKRQQKWKNKKAQNKPQDENAIPKRLESVDEILQKTKIMARPLFNTLKIFSEPISKKNLTELLNVSC